MDLRFWLKLMFLAQITQDLLDSGVYSMDTSIVCDGTNQYMFTNKTTLRQWCCRKCERGTKVEEPCSPGQPNTTKCIQCPEGQYQPEANGLQYCKNCDVQFKANRHLLSNCTATRNKKYGRCQQGFYYNRAYDSCERCKLCPPGIGVETTCTSFTNTICSPTKCQPGTYSDKSSFSQRCQKCRTCETHEEMFKECSPVSNYGCRLKGISTTPTKLLITRITTRMDTLILSPSKSKNSSSNNRGWVMPFFVSAMALLLFMFLIFVIGIGIWCHRHSKKKRRRRDGAVECPMIENGTKLSLDDTSCSMVSRESCNNYQIMIPKKVSENGMMLRDVSHDVIEKLGTFLNPGNANNWKKLATHLGFSWDYIRNLELHPTMATQKLLSSWVTKKEATVYALYLVLKQLERDDAADILEGVLSDPFSYQTRVA